MLTSKRILASLLYNGFGEKYRDYVDYDSIEIEESDMVSRTFSESRTDLTISLKFRNYPLRVALIVEHKSYFNLFMPLQMTNYIVEWSYPDLN